MPEDDKLKQQGDTSQNKGPDDTIAPRGDLGFFAGGGGQDLPFYSPYDYYNPYAGYSGYGYGYGGGGGGGGLTQPQKDAAGDLAAIAGYGADTILGKADQSNDVYDISDQGSKTLMEMQGAAATRAAGAEWFSNLLKQQSATSATRDKMGNASNGSASLDLITDMARYSDAISTSILESLENNLSSIDAEYYEALLGTTNGRNEMAMDTEAKLREGFADFISQLVNINPDLFKEDAYKGVIDNENHTLNPLDWLQTKYYEEHKRQAPRPIFRQHIRPGAARQKTYQSGLNPNRTNNSSAANQRYWQTMTTDYGHRSR